MADNPQVEIEIADDTGNPIPVSQFGAPWSVSVSNFPATFGVTQSTSPWVISGNVNAAQSGVWSTGRTWNLASGSDSVAAVQSGTWTVQQGTPPWSVIGTNAAGTSGTLALTIQGIAHGSLVPTLPKAPVSSNSYPNPISAYPDPETAGFVNDYNLTLDVFDNLQTRGPVITDEGSFRDDFSGSSLYNSLTGSLKFSSNSTRVDGVGTSFTTEVSSGFYIKRTAGGESELIQVDYVQDDTTLYLVSPYSGNFNNVASHISRYKILTAATAGTTSVASSNLSLSSGTASGGQSYIQNNGDYLPYIFECSCAITQRIANQTTILGFSDNPSSPSKQAVVQFDGTSNTTVKFVTASSSAAADIQTSTVTLPAGATTASQNVYEIDLTADGAILLINGAVMATHINHLPGPYDVLTVSAAMTNSAVVTATTLNIDWILWNNLDRLNITNDMVGAPTPVTGTVNATPIDGVKATYSASIVGLVPANLATDIFTITGSATKIVRITHIEISATQTTAGNANVVVLKRSTANTGGTSTNPAKVPHDSQNAAASATVAAYTANPTVGTLVGNIRSNKIFVSTATTMGEEITMDFGVRPSQAVVLRGTAEVLAVNLNGVTLAGGSFDIDIEWSEE